MWVFETLVHINMHDPAYKISSFGDATMNSYGITFSEEGGEY